MASDLHSAEHATPTARLGELLHLERGDLWVLGLYTIAAGLLALVVPLAAQALVNSIAANVSAQPLVVLTFLVAGAMVLVGVLQVTKMQVVEVLQQRVFARTSLQVAERLSNVREAALRGEYAPELVNRFFDVLTVQKALSKLLFDGFAALLQAFVGLALLAAYNPLLFGFDLILLATIAVIIGLLGKGGVTTSIAESKEKYHVAGWLEEIARCHASVKLHGALGYFVGRTDDLVVAYLRYREKHFRILRRQMLGYYLFQAAASAGILAAGGYLVIQRQLTLGQLVAAQIIVVSLLAALEKLLRQAEQVFDLLTGLDKVGHILDLPSERGGGNALIGDASFTVAPAGASARLQEVRFSYTPGSEVLAGVNLVLSPGERVCVVGASGAGKTTITSLLCGLEEPSHGVVAVENTDVRDWNLAALRGLVARVGGDRDIFEGTITENIAMGRDDITPQRLHRALELSGLERDLARMPLGTQTPLVPGGQNLSRGQAQRLLIARAIAGAPRLLILDEAFNALDEQTANEIRDVLFDRANPWTLFAVTHNPETLIRCERVLVLNQGRIVEEGTPLALAQQQNSALCRLFPSLGDSLRGRAARLREETATSREQARHQLLATVG